MKSLSPNHALARPTRSVGTVVALALVLAPLSAGGEPSHGSKPHAPQAPTAAEKKICRTVPRLGSILSYHICATREQWEEVVRAHEGDGDILAFSQHPNAATIAQQQGP
jgi:hypothetical protein